MKRGFTLIELLIVVVVIATLTTIVFRLAGVGGDSTRRATTVARLQRVENALSGYYAAFGTYPPVPLQGSRDIYQHVDAYHGVQLEGADHYTIDSSYNDEKGGGGSPKDRILAACRSQPFGAYFPFREKDLKYAEGIADAYGKLPDNAPVMKNLSDKQKEAIKRGFKPAGGNNVGGLDTTHSSWWGGDNVQLWRYGVMSFLLPRYLFMMQQSDDFKVEEYAQWTAYNDLPFDPETGVLYGNGNAQNGWRRVRQDYGSNGTKGRDSWKIELIPSQAACARWMPNFERICAASQDVWEFWGTRIKGTQDQDHWLSIYYVPPIYSAGAEGQGNQYVLDCITIKDGWGCELFYYSPPPHQTYRVWSSGPNGMTFPPWMDMKTLEESERKIVLNWTKDDIAVMKN